MSATTTARRCTVGTGDREQGAVLVENASLQVFQLRRGVDPEALDEYGPGVAERTQGLALSARPVQRQHVQGAQVLAKGMLDGQRVQFGDDLTVPSRPQVGVDPVLERGQAQLRQTGDLAVEEAMGLDVGVGMAAPHRQRLAQPGRDVLGVAHGRRGPVGVLERRRVDRGAGAVDEGSRRPGGRSRRRGRGGGWTRTSGASPGWSGRRPRRRSPGAGCRPTPDARRRRPGRRPLPAASDRRGRGERRPRGPRTGRAPGSPRSERTDGPGSPPRISPRRTRSVGPLKNRSTSWTTRPPVTTAGRTLAQQRGIGTRRSQCSNSSGLRRSSWRPVDSSLGSFLARRSAREPGSAPGRDRQRAPPMRRKPSQ